MPDAHALARAKARALVREHFGVTDTVELSYPSGAALRAGDRVWVYEAGSSQRCLGKALAATLGNGGGELHLIVDDDNGDLARRAGLLDPAIDVRRAVGRELVPIAATARPTERIDETDPGVAALVAQLRDAGVEIVVEHETIYGEVRGLEVARIARDEHGHPELHVGVGRYDQEANRVMSADLPEGQALVNALSEVRVHRHRTARAHPINRLARERWLRAQVLADPDLVGVSGLEPTALGLARRNLRDPAPAAALGVDGNGGCVLVMCTVGVDLELVPETADVADRERADRVVFVSAARDRHAIQSKIAARLRLPHEFVSVEGEWATIH